MCFALVCESLFRAVSKPSYNRHNQRLETEGKAVPSTDYNPSITPDLEAFPVSVRTNTCTNVLKYRRGNAAEETGKH